MSYHSHYPTHCLSGMTIGLIREEAYPPVGTFWMASLAINLYCLGYCNILYERHRPSFLESVCFIIYISW